MKMLLPLAALIALGAAPALAEPHAGRAGHAAPSPAPAAAAKSGQGVGKVKAVDAKAGKLTLHHGPIPALGWPAMTMPFKAEPGLLAAIRPGQTVTFTATDGEIPTITAIAPH